MVIAQPIASDVQKLTPLRSNHGMIRNIGSDGSTNQKVASTCAAMFGTSGLSCQSQIMPSTETSGSDAISAPKPGNLFATPETIATITPEIAALMKRQSIELCIPRSPDSEA